MKVANIALFPRCGWLTGQRASHLVVGYPACLDIANASANATPFWSGPVFGTQPVPLSPRVIPSCVNCGSIELGPTLAVPRPTVCGDCCDCLEGTCRKCGAYEDEFDHA